VVITLRLAMKASRKSSVSVILSAVRMLPSGSCRRTPPEAARLPERWS
jgi:hypothetical protein